MANQPPVRPWLRLTSLRPAAPAPAPAPAPPSRPPLALPTFKTASAPASPQTQPSQPSEPTSRPPPPEPKAAPAVTAAQFAGAADRASAPSSSPSVKAPEDKTTKSPKPAVQSAMQPSNLKLVTPPPSLLTLPPSQLKNNSEVQPKIPVEAEQKAMLVQKIIEKPKQGVNGNGDHEKHVKVKEIETKGKDIHRKVSDSEYSGVRVITIAGENRGAYMEIIQFPKKHQFGDKPNNVHKKGNSKIKEYAYESENSGSGEGNANRKDKNHKDTARSSVPMTAYMNSNVQCVNNSLMFKTSCSTNDPGVSLSLSKKPFGEEGFFHLKERRN